MIAWQGVAKLVKPEILQNIWELAEENLTTEEIINKLLFDTDHKGKTVLQLAAFNSEIEVLQELRMWAKGKLTTDDVSKKLLFARDHDGRTV
jgi:predicted transcriptional regulator